MITQNPVRVAFMKGYRTYFIIFQHLSNGKIKYGATIHRLGGVSEIPDNDSHFSTANERFTRFPVVTIEKFIIPDNVKTRSQLVNYYNSKAFQKILIKNLCKYGVRSRSENKTTSLKEKEFNLKHYLTKKHYNRNVQNYYDNLNRHKKNRDIVSQKERLLRRRDDFPGNKNTFKMVFRMDKRIFHIAYARHKWGYGYTYYGASIYRLNSSKNTGANYSEKAHLDTAINRLYRFPIKVIIDDCRKMKTRHSDSGELPYWKNSVMLKFRKIIAKYGVRDRYLGSGHKFVTTHILEYNLAKDKKNYNKKRQLINRERVLWNKVRTIG